MRLKETRDRAPWRRLTALSAALLLVAGACGDDNGDDGDTEAGDGGEEEVTGDFGGRIVGIEPGSGIMERTREDVIPTYGLDEAGFTLQDSSTPAMLQELESAIDNEEWIAVTLWQPHWAYSEWDLKNLEDPENTLGTGEDLRALGREGFSEDFPEVAEQIDRFSLTADELAGLTNQVVNQTDGEDEEDQAAADWVEENRDLVDEWVGEGTDGEGETITIGWIPWDEDVAITYVWEDLLEEQGFEVEKTQLDVGPLYQGLASGDLDLFLDAWLPNTHASYWEDFGDQIEELGIWNEEATLHITVPSYVPIDSIEEMADHAG